MVYHMEIGASEESFYFKTGDVTKILYCPTKRQKQYNKDKSYYFFDKITTNKFLWKGFPLSPKSSTSSILGRKLWECLWSEGWREKKQI